jgi:hypothetical protein
VAPVTSGLAIASLVLSILWLGGLGSILAVVFALVAMSQINQSQGRKQGRGLAIAGLVVGLVGVAGSVGFYALAVAAGRAVHSITTEIGHDLTPTDLRLGQAGTYSSQQDDGVVGITVQSVSFPVTTTNTLATPPAGDELALAKIRECAGPSGLPNGADATGWQLIMPDGTTISPSFPAAKSPDLSNVTALSANSCVTGYLSFQIASGSTPAWIEYVGAVFHPYQWRIGS